MVTFQINEELIIWENELGQISLLCHALNKLQTTLRIKHRSKTIELLDRYLNDYLYKLEWGGYVFKRNTKNKTIKVKNDRSNCTESKHF